MSNLPYYLGFSYQYGVGPVKFDKLIAEFGSVQKAYEATIKNFDSEKILKQLRKEKITVLSREDARYPPSLLAISDPPICVYIKGDLDRFDWSRDILFAIVGTRRPSSYGVQITKKFSEELATAGFVIVSGMAIGIDATAHWASITAGGRTIAILGSGVDVPSPSSNKKLYEKIIADNGIVLSEFPPEMSVKAGMFISRNRLISGLSRGTLVIEGSATSGALATARFAAEQGREVFAPPAPITSEMSVAPNILLKEGARLTTSVADILDEFNLKLIPSKKSKIEGQLSKEEKRIFEIISREPAFIDEIVVELQTNVNSVLNTLSILEIRGVIERNSESKYQIKV